MSKRNPDGIPENAKRAGYLMAETDSLGIFTASYYQGVTGQGSTPTAWLRLTLRGRLVKQTRFTGRRYGAATLAWAELRDEFYAAASTTRIIEYPEGLDPLAQVRIDGRWQVEAR